MKKVLFIVIDALATRVVEPALREGRLPNLAQLVNAGVMRSECTSIFPSITPAATCALATGCYPRQHGIAGAYWYDREQDEVAYFGTDIWAVLNEGVAHYLRDFQQELNARRLRVPTIFERIESHGHLRDAVINLMWFRGTVDHEVSIPLPLSLLPGVANGPLRGPHWMFMGDFVNTPLDQAGNAISARGGMLRRFGFHDETTADYLIHLTESAALPEFTLAYFPNNDFESHERGPQAAVTVLEAFDATLDRLFELHGGLLAMINEFAIVITGDHSQSDLTSSEEAAINLDKVLAELQVAKAGDRWRTGDDVMACPNMRSAQIYVRSETAIARQRVIDQLLEGDGIDQVIWCRTKHGMGDWNDTTFYVMTQGRGSLAFQPTVTSRSLGQDCFGGHWWWEGDLSAIDARVDAQGQLQFGDYPNAFERIANAFCRQSGNIWVTARLGREFCLPGTQCNGRGSHGSLHVLDSTSPLIVAGLPETVILPNHTRTVDVVPLCLSILGLESEHAMGASHVSGYSQ